MKKGFWKRMISCFMSIALALSAFYNPVAAETAAIKLDVRGIEAEGVFASYEPYWVNGTVKGTGEEMTITLGNINTAAWTQQAQLKDIPVTGGETYIYEAFITSDKDRVIGIKIGEAREEVELLAGVEKCYTKEFTAAEDAAAVTIVYEVGYSEGKDSAELVSGSNVITVKNSKTEPSTELSTEPSTELDPVPSEAEKLVLTDASVSSNIASYDPYWAGGTVTGTGEDLLLDMTCISSEYWTNEAKLEIAANPDTTYVFCVYLNADTNRTIAVDINGKTEFVVLEANKSVKYTREVVTDAETEKITVRYLVGYNGEKETEGAWGGSRIRITSEPQLNNLDITADKKAVTLTWDTLEDVNTYDIYRAKGKYAEYEKIGSADGTAAAYTDIVTDSIYNYYYKVKCNFKDGASVFSGVTAMDIKLFGDSVKLFSAGDDTESINKEIKKISDSMIPAATAEFSEDRFAILFKPGTYNINKVDVGYYTQIAGLGKTPYEVSIPNINVDTSVNGNALVNFWRSVENLSINTGSKDTEVKWAASQAAPLRRLYVNGKLHFDDVGTPASGGFLADTYVTGKTGSWSQQQFFVRNSNLTDGWYDGCWNMMFAGVLNAPENTADWGAAGYQSYTTEETVDEIREKPFLYVDEAGDYNVFVPALRKDASGVSWSESSMGEGTSISLTDFYVARADADTADTMNAALESGKHLLLTPGIYEVDKPIQVKRAGTVVLGLGMATIRVNNKQTGMKVADESGITVAGVLFDAGEQGSDTLLQVGNKTDDGDHSEDPILLADVFTRVGGGTIVGKTEQSVVINSSDVIGDHFWLWRADHGTDVSWTTNTAKNGLVVNGNNVAVYGLFVEHFQEYQTLWNGEDGKVYFYQSELPYDVPYQTDWMSHNGTVKGYASYKVADGMKNHLAEAMGIYSIFNHTKEYITLENAIEVNTGARVRNACTVALVTPEENGNGGIAHVINGLGSFADSASNAGKKIGINSYYLESGELRAELQKLYQNYAAKEIRAEDYIDAAYPEAYENALQAAEELLKNETASREQINQVLTGLKQAIEDLENARILSSAKKGIGSWYYASDTQERPATQEDIEKLSKAGVTWFYNWSLVDKIAEFAKNTDMEYVPMLWSGAYVNDTFLTKLKKGAESGLYQHVLAFNEPDLPDQANMTVEDALDAYGQILEALEGTGIKIGSPAGAAVEDDWIAKFMEGAKKRGYRVDFLTIHVYQDVTNPSSVENLNAALNRLYEKYQLPIWITEIGATDVSANWKDYQLYGTLNHESVLTYMEELTEMLEGLDYVERYAWFVDYSSDTDGTAYTRIFDINTDTLTEEGKFYATVGDSGKADGGEDSKPVAVSSVRLDSAKAELKVGETKQLTATVLPENAENKKVSWSSSDAAVAEVSTEGMVTAKGIGTAVITVKTAEGEFTASCSIKVTAKEGDTGNTKPGTGTTISVTGVTLNKKTVTLNKGKTLTLKAVVAPANATNQTVTWKSSRTKVARVDANGKVKAVNKGTAVITATTADGKKTASCKVTVKIPAKKIKFNTKRVYVVKGKSVRIKATMTPLNSTDKVTWKSSKKSVATVKNGKITAKKLGRATITAKTTSGKKVTCKVHVVKKATKSTAVKLNKKTLIIKKGGRYDIVPKMTPYNSTDIVKWKSSNKKVVTVDAFGTVIGKKGGTATITAKTTSGKKYTCKVKVKVAAKKVKLDKAKLTMKKGKMAKLKAVKTPSDSTDTLKWSSSNKKVVTVDKNGRLKAVKKGTATVTVKTSGGKTAVCKVTVK